jgi:HK97 family phage major capsid protein
MEAATSAKDTVLQALAEFRAINDKALDEKADKGYVDSVLKESGDKALSAALEKMDKANAAVTERLDGIETRIEKNLFQRGADDKSADMLAKFCRSIGADVPIEQYRFYRKAFGSYLIRGDKALAPDLQAAMSVGSDPDGGYFVPPDMSGAIHSKVFELSPIRQIANVENTSSDALEGPYEDDEAGVGWVGETPSRTETTTPTRGMWRIPVHEIYAMPKTTQKVLDMASNIEGWLSAKVSSKKAREESTQFVTGNGILKPRGFLSPANATTDDSTRAWGTIQYVITGVSADFPAAPAGGDVFIDAWGKLKAAYRANARWLMSRSTLAAAMKEKDSNGNYVWQPNFQQNALGINILGYPVLEAEDMPALAANSLSIAFGDFREAYTIVDGTGIRVLRDPFTEKGHVLFYTTSRVGGDVVNSEAYKLIKFGTS